MNSVLPRDAMYSADNTVARCLYVCLSVCHTQLSKRLHISLKTFFTIG